MPSGAGNWRHDSFRQSEVKTSRLIDLPPACVAKKMGCTNIRCFSLLEGCYTCDNAAAKSWAGNHPSLSLDHSQLAVLKGMDGRLPKSRACMIFYTRSWPTWQYDWSKPKKTSACPKIIEICNIEMGHKQIINSTKNWWIPY